VFSVNLPKGYSIDIKVSQHRSGKVSISQGVGLTVGFIDLSTFKVDVETERGSLGFQKRFHSFVELTERV